MLYMFRTVLVHHQEQLLYAVNRIWYMPVPYVAIATQQPDVSAYTKCDVQRIKVAHDDGLIQSETCTASNRK